MFNRTLIHVDDTHNHRQVEVDEKVGCRREMEYNVKRL